MSLRSDVTWLMVAMAATLWACGDAKAAKVDIRGVHSGMTKDEAERAIGGTCRRQGAASQCLVDGDAMLVMYTQHLHPEASYEVSLTFCSADDAAKVVNNVRQTYGIDDLKLDGFARQGSLLYSLRRDGFCSRNQATGQAYLLDIQDVGVMSKDAEAARSTMPATKF